jgi:hypothetical protein
VGRWYAAGTKQHLLQEYSLSTSGGALRQIDNGTGKFTLPKGFEYDAVAAVECDAGKVIESRESRPNQRINVADGVFPAEMTFVIPGPRCTLWVSH